MTRLQEMESKEDKAFILSTVNLDHPSKTSTLPSLTCQTKECLISAQFSSCVLFNSALTSVSKFTNVYTSEESADGKGFALP